MMSAYFEKVRPTYIENWSQGLKELTIPQTDLPISLEEARALGHVNKEFRKWFGDAPPFSTIERLAKKIDSALTLYPEGAFVRLGSRSGKDSSYANNRGLRISDGNAAIRMLTENSWRIAYDLRLALHHDYSPHIFVRRWRRIPPWSEFRCFMKRRKLVGISQYDCKNFGSSVEINRNAKRIEASVRKYFSRLQAVSHVDDAVFDMFVEFDEQTLHGPVIVQLLEINPFFQKTDACLFHWGHGGDFDGSFRFISDTQAVISVGSS